jgi:benzoyl-CoA reductase/2-hydroxyglutaryl-CoA dehydratase subunit BcrC/BadD/HgdB
LSALAATGPRFAIPLAHRRKIIYIGELSANILTRDLAMIKKDKAETILAEIRQQVEAGNTDRISFSSQTILWMAESLVEAIAEVENKTADLQAITAKNERNAAALKELKEEYFKLTQDIRKAETSGIAMESREKLLKKWRGEAK